MMTVRGERRRATHVRRVTLPLLAALAVVLAACGEDWSTDVADAGGMVASDRSLVTVTDQQVRAHDLDGEQRWETRLDGRDAFQDGRDRVWPMSVDVGADLVAVLAYDDREPARAWVVHALDVQDGRRQWSVRFEETEPTLQPRLGVRSGSVTDFSSGLAVTEDAVVAVTPADEVVALEATDGRERWRVATEGRTGSPVTSLTAGAGMVVVTDAFGVRGLALADGAVLFTVDEPTSFNRPPGVVIDDAVYLVSHSSVRAIELDGSERWAVELRTPDGLGALAQHTLTPTLVDESLLGAWRSEPSEPILVRAYDRADGRMRWEQRDANLPVGRQENPWEHPGTLLDLDGVPAVATQDLRVLDPDDGGVTRVVRLDRALERGIVLRDGALVYLDEEVLRSRVVGR